MKYDKLLHLLVGFCIYICFVAITSSHMISFLAVILAAIGKEVYDVHRGGKGDFYDFYATVGGGIFGIVIWSLV